MKFDCGCTRFVILTKRWAIKVPNFKYGWKAFLEGLLANMQERHFWKIKFGVPKICPVVFSLPLGFLVVMPKCQALDRPLTDDELKEFFAVPWGDSDVNIPIEDKPESFGWLDGRLVAIDYGN
jgi:hypothetical protein